MKCSLAVLFVSDLNIIIYVLLVLTSHKVASDKLYDIVMGQLFKDCSFRPEETFTIVFISWRQVICNEFLINIR